MSLFSWLRPARSTFRQEARVVRKNRILTVDETDAANAIRRRICAIEGAGGHFGTGMLVAADLVLTNHHVIATVPREMANTGCVCRFGFERADAGFATPLHADWLVLHGKPDVRPPGMPEERWQATGIDYALIRLARPVGNLDENGRDPGPDDSTRGWITLRSRNESIDSEAAIDVWHHPGVEAAGQTGLQPVSCSPGVLRVLDGGSRLAHDASTLPGSSGGACFHNRTTLVALHQGSEDGEEGERNIAIPIWRIVQDIERKRPALERLGRWPLMDQEPPPSAALYWKGQVSAVIVSEEIVRHRVEAASILIDREGPERRFVLDTRGAALARVLLTRDVDLEDKFFERLRVVSLPGVAGNGATDARRLVLRRESAPTPWDRRAVDWPDPTVPGALEELLYSLEQIPLQRGFLVHAHVEIGKARPEADRALLAALVAHWRAQPGPHNIQFFLTYHERVDEPEFRSVWDDRRRDVTAVWSAAPREPGLGACIGLENVALDDVRVWCSDLDEAWTMRPNQAFSAVERTWKSAPSAGAAGALPMRSVEAMLAPVIREFARPGR